jgi:glycerol-3-phosphate dehydrogenase
VLIPSLGEDRFLFIIPWQGRTIIGTTDSKYTGDLDDPRATDEEIAHLVKSAARYFPDSKLDTGDVISSFAGLRPLVGGAGQTTSDLSREEQIIEEDSGMISIIGGKLTTYRRIAERAINLAEQRIASSRKQTHESTRGIKLAGASPETPEAHAKTLRLAEESGIRLETIEHLSETYGANYSLIVEIASESQGAGRPLIEGLPHIEAEAVYAGRFEMAATAEDFLSRRTRISLLARDHGESCASRVAELIRD